MRPDEAVHRVKHSLTIYFHLTAAGRHTVATGDEQQALRRPDLPHHRHLTCHRQAPLALAHVGRKRGISTGCRLAIDQRHHSPGLHQELFHVVFFHDIYAKYYIM